eukprot:EG_transcript_7408
MEEDDEVVGEFDVFIGQQMPNQLYLLQFPLRPSWRPYDVEQLKAVRMKKGLQKVEMDFQVNTKGENYNKEWKDKAEGRDDTFTLTSTRMIPKTKYAIGVLNADGFHLTSLPNVLQMRPDMSGCKVGGVRRIDDEKAEDKAPRQAQSKHVAEMLARQQQRLFSFNKEKEAKEQWSLLSFFLADSIEATSQIPHLYCNTTVRIRTGITPQKYLDAIFPPVKSDEATAVQKWSKLPLSRVLDYPLDRRIYSLLLSAHVMPFSRIKQLVSPDHKATDAEIIARLEQCAVLARGVWVIKAQQHYRGQLAAVRELLLHAFWQDGVVGKRAFIERIPNRTTPPEDIAQLFVDVATLHRHPDRPGGVWRLKHPPDEDFLAAHPDVVSKQTALWEGRGPRIVAALEGGSNALTFPWAPPEPSSDGAAAAAAPAAADAQSQPKAVQRFIFDSFRKYGVCAPAVLRAEYRSKKADSNNPLALTTEELYGAVLEKMTRKFNDCLVLAKLGIPELDKWREPMLQAFQERREMRKEQVVERIKELCGEEIPAGHFGRLVRELATPSTTRQTWTAKAGFMGKGPGEQT